MDFIIDAIVEWLKGLLVDGIMGNLDGLFDNVNQSVGEIATQVGTTPADWNAGVFSMIRQISETAILPIAGVILTFVSFSREPMTAPALYPMWGFMWATG